MVFEYREKQKKRKKQYLGGQRQQMVNFVGYTKIEEGGGVFSSSPRSLLPHPFFQITLCEIIEVMLNLVRAAHSNYFMSYELSTPLLKLILDIFTACSSKIQSS